MSSTAREIPPRVHRRDIWIPSSGVWLGADVAVPAKATGLVIFAHGSGSGRHSPRNRYVAEVLNEQGLATVLVGLLTVDEERLDRHNHQLRFDIPLLAGRLAGITEWSREQPELRNLERGYFGASTCAAAALIAAASQQNTIRTLVLRGGRPDLAGDFLARVMAPVLLLVGGHDPEVLKLNKLALESLNDDSCLDVIPRASHLFEEPGALEAVAQLAGDWFTKHLG
jgi:putative phosphoribosyl transferase